MLRPKKGISVVYQLMIFANKRVDDMSLLETL